MRARPRPKGPPAETCRAVRVVGEQEFRCDMPPDHDGIIHMSPGDSGDSLADPKRGPFMVSWPARS